MIDDIQIQFAQSDHLDEIISLIKSVEGDTESILASEFMVAVRNSHIVGCGRIKIYADGTHELGSIAVKEELRSTGIGTQLISALLRFCLYRPVYLLCIEQNVNFFSRFGFAVADQQNVPLGLIPKFHRYLDSHMILMVLRGGV